MCLQTWKGLLNRYQQDEAWDGWFDWHLLIPWCSINVPASSDPWLWVWGGASEVNSAVSPEVGRGTEKQFPWPPASSVQRHKLAWAPFRRHFHLGPLGECSVNTANTRGFYTAVSNNLHSCEGLCRSCFHLCLLRLFSMKVWNTQSCWLLSATPSHGTTGRIFIISIIRGKRAACGNCLPISRACPVLCTGC